MVMVKSSYGPKNGLTTTMGREGVDLGPAPDFWADLARMRSQIKAPPRPRVQTYTPPPMRRESAPVQQAQALRSSGPTMSFVKRIGGPNIVSGYISSYAGDPGSVYGGYIPEGAITPGAAQPMPQVQYSGSRGAFAGDPYFAADYAKAIANSQNGTAADDGRYSVPVVRDFDSQGRPIVGPDLLR